MEGDEIKFKPGDLVMLIKAHKTDADFADAIGVVLDEPPRRCKFDNQWSYPVWWACYQRPAYDICTSTLDLTSHFYHVDNLKLVEANDETR